MKTCKFCLNAVDKLSNCKCDGYLNEIKRRNERHRECSKKRLKKQVFSRLIMHAHKRNKINTIKKFDLWKIAKKQKLKCALTGDKLTAENISLDHIIPTCRGGTNDINNLQLVIRKVNTAKWGVDNNEFIELCKRVALMNK